ncbi:MAG: hypothetical protein ACR2IK_08900 [Chloroflexota bacterium]
MSPERYPASPIPRVHLAAASPRYTGRGVVVAVGVLMATLLILPATALGQTATPGPGTPGSATPGAGTATAMPPGQATAAPAASAALTLSTASGLAGASITANGSGFKPTETVDVTFNGQVVGTPLVNAGGTFSLSFSVPSVTPGQYAVLAKGRNSELSATTAFAVTQGGASLTFSVPQAAPGTSLTVTGAGFQPGESVQVMFNGAVVGAGTVDTKGGVTATFVVPALAAGQYDVTATGATSAVATTASYTVLAGAASTATAGPTAAATPAPAATPASGPAPNAPAIVHDDRYFSQTGYRVDDDNVWGFFNQYGGLSTFGYPVSRMMSLLGCPVQMFQRQIIQVCAGSGAALINMLDPDIFPYTKVNGSTFPAADPTLKANTPPVTSATYSTDISSFVQANVPDTFSGQPVNFQQTFNTLGGLTIWGAPISSPQPDPSNGNFIYQRFQRGVMHYTVGTGTQSILLADYLKAIIMNQNVPTDLAVQAQPTRFFNQYCPSNTLWLCRPGELAGTDLTYAFVNG